MATKYIFPSPVEEKFFEIIQNGHLVKTENQFQPLLELDDIDENTDLPVFKPLTLRSRRSEDKETWYTDVIATVYDLFPQISFDMTPAQIHRIAVFTAYNYQADLLEMIDILTDEDGPFGDCYYDFVGEQVFSPDYRRDAFRSKLEYEAHPFRDRLLGSSVLFTLRGQPHCIECNRNFKITASDLCIGCQ